MPKYNVLTIDVKKGTEIYTKQEIKDIDNTEYFELEQNQKNLHDKKNDLNSAILIDDKEKIKTLRDEYKKLKKDKG